MSLLNSEITSSTSRDQKLQNLVTRLKRMSVETYKALVQTQKQGIDMAWNHPEFTPQEIIDALGEDAIKLFQFHGGLTDYLVAISSADGVDYSPAVPSQKFSIVDGVIIIQS